MTQGTKFFATAPSKAILAGEHSVVHGRHALVVALNLFSKVIVTPIQERRFIIVSDKFGTARIERGSPYDKFDEFKPLAHMINGVFEEMGLRGGVKIEIYTEPPPESGLGSSASVFVAISAALLKMLGHEPEPSRVFELGMVGETVAHLNPSGVDVWVSTNGGAVLYKRGETPSQLAFDNALPIVVGLSEVSRSTSTMVEKFGRNLTLCQEGGKHILDIMDDVAKRGAEMLQRGDHRGLGELMTYNHFILTKMGVSMDTLDRMVWASLEAGALGAKLTGAGGGGATISLCERTSLGPVQEAIVGAGGKPLNAGVTKEGFKVWEET